MGSTAYPKLLSQKTETLARNIEAVASRLNLERDAVLRVALRFPPLFYLRAETVASQLEEFASLTGAPVSVVKAALLAAPTLAGRSALTLARKMRLCLRIARALGKPTTAVSVHSCNTCRHARR